MSEIYSKNSEFINNISARLAFADLCDQSFFCLFNFFLLFSLLKHSLNPVNMKLYYPIKIKPPF